MFFFVSKVILLLGVIGWTWFCLILTFARGRHFFLCVMKKMKNQKAEVEHINGSCSIRFVWTDSKWKIESHLNLIKYSIKSRVLLEELSIERANFQYSQIFKKYEMTDKFKESEKFSKFCFQSFVDFPNIDRNLT